MCTRCVGWVSQSSTGRHLHHRNNAAEERRPGLQPGNERAGESAVDTHSRRRPDHARPGAGRQDANDRPALQQRRRLSANDWLCRRVHVRRPRRRVRLRVPARLFRPHVLTHVRGEGGRRAGTRRVWKRRQFRGELRRVHPQPRSPTERRLSRRISRLLRSSVHPVSGRHHCSLNVTCVLWRQPNTLVGRLW